MHTCEIVPSAANESEVFWGAISPCEHLVQIYQDDGVFLDFAGRIRIRRLIGR